MRSHLSHQWVLTLAGDDAGVAGVRVVPGSVGTASVTTPYGMNCSASLAMPAAFRCAERQL